MPALAELVELGSLSRFWIVFRAQRGMERCGSIQDSRLLLEYASIEQAAALRDDIAYSYRRI